VTAHRPFRVVLLCVFGVALLGPARTARGRASQTPPSLSDTGTLVFPPKDPGLQRALERTLAEPRFRKLSRAKAISVALVDLTAPGAIRYAGVDDDHMRYAASLPKIAILLGLFDAIERGDIAYTPEIREKTERMIRRSENAVSTELLELVGFDAIALTLEDPRYELYGPDRNGGLWVGRDYGGGQGLWQRDSLHDISHGATARQVARFFVMMDRGLLVSPWASAEMKSIMGDPELHHKFVKGLDRWPTAQVYRKSGTWRQWHADAALVERDGKKYVAVALLESSSAAGIFPDLIVRLDGLIKAPGQGRVGKGP
jgi:beta-lactamase class A